MVKKWRVLAVLVCVAVLLVACSEKEKETKKPAKEKPATVKKIGTSATETLREHLAQYEDVNVAIEEGYEPLTPYESGRGYRFVHAQKQHIEPHNPNALLYGLNSEGQFVLVGAEWLERGGELELPLLYEGVSWNKLTPAGGYYQDGSFLESAEEHEHSAHGHKRDASFLEEAEGNVPVVHPVTQAELVRWMPSLTSISFFLEDSGEGVFAKESELVRKEYDEIGLHQPMASHQYVLSLASVQ